ncbi:HAD family hydrolase [Enterococcus sp. LJL90]
MTAGEIKLVISDIDGTILNDQHQVEEPLKLALRQLKQKDIPFILASARSPKGMYQIAADLNLQSEPLACYNGALILKEANPANYQPLFSHEIKRHEAQKIVTALLTNFPALSISLYSGADWYAERLDRWVEIEATITEDTPKIHDISQLLENAQLPIHKFLIVGEVAEIEIALGFLKELPLSETVFYLSKDNYLEITHQAVSKEKALRELAAYYHVDLKEVLTIGDNFNDLPMLELAGIGVAMANAPEAVRQQARFQTVSNNQHGVAQALAEYVLKEKN